MEADGRIVHRLRATISRDASPRSRRRLLEPCLAEPVHVVIGIRGALKGIHGEQPVDTSDLLGEHAARELKRAATYMLNVVLAVVVGALAMLPQVLLNDFNPWITTAGVLGVLGCLLGFRVALQWDRAVVLRLGRFHALKGPGTFGMIPFLDSVARYVDMRIRATEFFSDEGGRLLRHEVRELPVGR